MILGIHHTAIAVRNLDEWLEFFSRTFELATPPTHTVADQGVKIAFFKLGNSEIEFMQPQDASNPMARFLDTRGEGVHHICFEVDDIKQDMKALAERGFLLAATEPVAAPVGQVVFIRPRSTKGVLLEIGQISEPKGLVAPASGKIGEMKLVTGVDHIAVAVRNLDEWLELFRRFCGLGASRIESVADQGIKVAVMKVGESQFELMQPVSASSALNRHLDTRGEGVHHICLEVDDVREAMKALTDKGVVVADKEPREGVMGRVAFIHPRSTKGLLLQIGQKP